MKSSTQVVIAIELGMPPVHSYMKATRQCREYRWEFVWGCGQFGRRIDKREALSIHIASRDIANWICFGVSSNGQLGKPLPCPLCPARRKLSRYSAQCHTPALASLALGFRSLNDARDSIPNVGWKSKRDYKARFQARSVHAHSSFPSQIRESEWDGKWEFDTSRSHWKSFG